MNKYGLQTKVSLKEYNTFGINVLARLFFPATNVKELSEFLVAYKQKNPYSQHLILGGGSNYLFTNNFEGLIIHPQMKCIEIVKDTPTEVYVKVAAGVVWDDFVKYACENNWYGVANLSHIPGFVGASPVQNIGAYGVEAKDVIHKIEALEIKTGKIYTLTNEECSFKYRGSIFKEQEFYNKYVVINVTFLLRKKADLETKYEEVNIEIEKLGEKNLLNLRQAIINIRKRKLPDPLLVGNAGSFFKNPIVKNSQLRLLKSNFPDIVSYKYSETESKISAAWLIEWCKWKGKRLGDAGVSENHALILVNYGLATGKQILALAEQIQYTVEEKFKVSLEPEVIIV